MANPRKQGVQFNAGRAYVTVYPSGGGSQRIYLKIRDDPATANIVYRAISAPLDRGDAESVRKRVEAFDRLQKRCKHLDASERWKFQVALTRLHDEFIEADDPEIVAESERHDLSHDDRGNLILAQKNSVCPNCDTNLPLVDAVDEIFGEYVKRGEFEPIRDHAAWAIEILAVHKRRDESRVLYDALLDSLGLKTKRKPASHERLSDVAKAFREIHYPRYFKRKMVPEDDRNYRDKRNRFNDWVAWIGEDLPVSRIQKRHLTGYEEHVGEKHAALSPKRRNDIINPVKEILRTVARKRKDRTAGTFCFPDQLMEWLLAIDSEKYQPNRSNRTSLSVETYKALLATAEKIATQDVTAIKLPKKGSTRTANMRRSQAIRTAGVTADESRRLAIMLPVAINCSFGPKDLSDLRMNHLHLDAEIPYIDLPREKPSATNAAREAIDRLTPLLPSVAESLRDYLDGVDREQVFANRDGNIWRENGITRAFDRLRKSAKLDAETCKLKFFRNVGPSLAFKNRIPEQEVERLQGHTPKTVAGKYYRDMGMIDETFVIATVNAIGAEYFDGERVAGSEDD